MSSTNFSDARHFESTSPSDSIDAYAPYEQTSKALSRRISIPGQTAMYLVAATGVAISGYLSWAALTSSKVAGCGSGQVFDCSHVLQSKWSSVLGMPVGLPATGLYLAVLASLATITFATSKRTQQIAGTVVATCAFAAAFAALWFISLQLFVVEHLCGYCLAAHACGLVLAALVIGNYSLGKSKSLTLALLSFLSVGAMATSQVLAAPPQTFQIENHSQTIENNDSNTVPESENLFSAPGFETSRSNDSSKIENQNEATIGNASPQPVSQSKTAIGNRLRIRLSEFLSPGNSMITFQPQQDPAAKSSTPGVQEEQENETEQERVVKINGGNMSLNVAHWPLAGQVEAEQIIVEMFDYTCPHCRENHRILKSAMDQLGNEKLAILELCVPMNSNCNGSIRMTDAIHAEACELAKLATAVWRVDQEQYQIFHEWMFEGDEAPSAEDALAKAKSLVDEEMLIDELNGDVVGQYIEKQVQLYQNLGAGTVPKLLFPQSTLAGKVGSVEALIDILNQQQ